MSPSTKLRARRAADVVYDVLERVGERGRGERRKAFISSLKYAHSIVHRSRKNILKRRLNSILLR